MSIALEIRPLSRPPHVKWPGATRFYLGGSSAYKTGFSFAHYMDSKKKILHVLLKTPKSEMLGQMWWCTLQFHPMSQVQKGHCEFEACMLYIMSSRLLMATQPDYVIWYLNKISSFKFSLIGYSSTPEPFKKGSDICVQPTVHSYPATDNRDISLLRHGTSLTHTPTWMKKKNHSGKSTSSPWISCSRVSCALGLALGIHACLSVLSWDYEKNLAAYTFSLPDLWNRMNGQKVYPSHGVPV